jgi:surface protein
MSVIEEDNGVKKNKRNMSETEEDTGVTKKNPRKMIVIKNKDDFIKRVKAKPSQMPDFDVTALTDMESIFKICAIVSTSYWGESSNKFNIASFNEDISRWNVSNVINMASTFSGCISFNQDISRWNVSRVNNMETTFLGCKAFNHDISPWVVSNVENMSYMFFDCKSFNQDISNWDVRKVKNIFRMFSGCTNFNQDLSKWFLRDLQIPPYSGYDMLHTLGKYLEELFIDTPMYVKFTTINQFLERDVNGNYVYPPANYPNVRDLPQFEALFAEIKRQEQFLLHPSNQVVEEASRAGHEIHNAFNAINFTELLKIIGHNNAAIPYAGNIDEFYDYVLDKFKQFINSIKDEEKKDDLTNQLNRLRNELGTVFLDLKKSGEGYKNLINTIVIYVDKQPVSFKENYITTFINDVLTANNTQKSCIKGIKERIITSIGNGGANMDENEYKPEYAEISKIIYPVKQLHVVHFVSKCVLDKDGKFKPELYDFKGPTERIEYIRICAMNKLREEGLINNINSVRVNFYMDDYMETLLESGMLENYNFMEENNSSSSSSKGGKRKTIKKRKTVKKKKNLKKRKTLKR